jgi:hypothetical protein
MTVELASNFSRREGANPGQLFSIARDEAGDVLKEAGIADDQQLEAAFSEALKRPVQSAKTKRQHLKLNATEVERIDDGTEVPFFPDDAEDDSGATAEFASRQSLAWVNRAQRQRRQAALKNAGSWIAAFVCGAVLIALTLLFLVRDPFEIVSAIALF